MFGTFLIIFAVSPFCFFTYHTKTPIKIAAIATPAAMLKAITRVLFFLGWGLGPGLGIEPGVGFGGTGLTPGGKAHRGAGVGSSVPQSVTNCFFVTVFPVS